MTRTFPIKFSFKQSNQYTKSVQITVNSNKIILTDDDNDIVDISSTIKNLSLKRRVNRLKNL